MNKELTIPGLKIFCAVEIPICKLAFAMVRPLLKRKNIPNIFSDFALDMTKAGNRIR